MTRTGIVMTLLLVPAVLSGCARTAGQAAPAAQAVQLLQQVALPAGAVRLHSASGVPTPFQSSDLGCEGLVEKVEYWRLPGRSIASIHQWWEGHVPDGLRLDGTGFGGDRSGETMTEVDLAVRHSSLATDGSRLVLTAVREDTGSAVRASAQVVPAGGCRSVHHRPTLHGPARTGATT